MPDWKDGDDIPPGQAKKATEEMLRDPRHQKAKGSPADLSTIDDPIETTDEGGPE